MKQTEGLFGNETANVGKEEHAWDRGGKARKQSSTEIEGGAF
jgi:hypothetical protein